MNEAKRREAIVSKWHENPQLPHHFIAKQLNIPRKTVVRVLKRYFGTHSTDRKPRIEEHNGARNSNLDKKITKAIRKHRSMSVRDVAKQF